MASMPGGNTRTVLHADPFPLTIARAEGARITDVDDHDYVDLLGEFTAGLYGHSNPIIVGAIREALADGVAFGAPNEYEAGLAAAITDRFPAIDLVRFCNSGTEANLLAISLARAATGRTRVMVFEGGYHGSVLGFATRAGSPMNAPFPYVIATYNDPIEASALIAEHAADLACVVVEPLQGSAGAIPADQAFLEALRTSTARHGVLLVFDEVMTSRLSPGGAQSLTGVHPDLTALGKYLGGGLTFGAFGGRRDLMERFDPQRPDALPHAGTFNNNVLTMAAGLAGLTQVLSDDVLDDLNRSGDALRERLTALGESLDVPLHASGRGSLIGLHLGCGPVRRIADTRQVAPAIAADVRTILHLALLERGFSQARRGFLSLSLPLTPADLDGYVEAVRAVLAEHAAPIRTAINGR
jgi:glutamate-1-semialdehyde 2,1-aminomutase